MSSSNDGGRRMGWKPKPFRPVDPPTPGEVEQLIVALKDADEPVRLVYRTLAISEPGQRLQQAVGTVLTGMGRSMPRSNELSNLLTSDEYKAYVYVAQNPNISPSLKAVAEALLCVADRHVVASFFRRAFTTLKGYSLFKLSLEVLRRIE